MSICCLVASLVIASATAPFPPAEPGGDLAGLQGTWRMWNYSEDYLILKIKDNDYSYIRHFADGREMTWGGTFTLNDRSTPKEMTLYVKDGQGRTVIDNLCIYELHGDTLIHSGGGTVERPARFYCAGARTGVFKREKRGG